MPKINFPDLGAICRSMKAAMPRLPRGFWAARPRHVTPASSPRSSRFSWSASEATDSSGSGVPVVALHVDVEETSRRRSSSSSTSAAQPSSALEVLSALDSVKEQMADGDAFIESLEECIALAEQIPADDKPLEALQAIIDLRADVAKSGGAITARYAMSLADTAGSVARRLPGRAFEIADQFSRVIRSHGLEQHEIDEYATVVWTCAGLLPDSDSRKAGLLKMLRA
jgi:hypothetical protein